MNPDQPPGWVHRILGDIREFSAELLQAGLAPSTPASPRQAEASPLRSTLQGVDLVCRRLPDLLRELDGDESFLVAEMVPSPTPRHAWQTRRPGDYAWHGDRLLPRRWLRPEPSPELRLEPLRWLAGFIGKLQEELKLHQSRLEKTRIAREGKTDYAQQEMQRLDAMEKSAVNASHRLDQCLAMLYRRAGRTFTGSQRLPHPFPRSAIWHGLRSEIRHLTQASALQTAAWLHAIDAESVSMAEIPYLYQRWCGLQIIRAAARLGWHTGDDAVGALLLGGVIELERAGSRVELWVEPRLGARQADRIGWRSARRDEELTPDFLFVCGPPDQRDAFVADATLSTGKDQREDRNQLARDKGSYRERIRGVHPVRIAGVDVVRKPLRSWAMAPIRGRKCHLGTDLEGRTGVIPLNGYAEDFEALEAWLEDVFAHASRAG